LRRVRGVKDGATVIDSEKALLVHRPGVAPTFAFPAGDATGIATKAEPAARDHVRVEWDAVDTWLEEEEELFMHPRNPYHRVDCVRTHRRLRVVCAGVVLVDTTTTVGVYETSLAPRLYVSPDHVLTELLVPSSTMTYCPYKGTASYWSAVVDDDLRADVAWSYEAPHPECQVIAGHLSFDDTRVDMTTTLPTGETSFDRA